MVREVDCGKKDLGSILTNLFSLLRRQGKNLETVNAQFCFFNMGLSRPLFGFIHCRVFYKVDYKKWLTIIGHFRTMLTRHVFSS